MGERGSDSSKTGFFDVSKADQGVIREVTPGEYLADRRARGVAQETGADIPREKDPAIAGIEAEMERVASELRDATTLLESRRRNAGEGAATVFALPGESGADAAKRVADEFAAKIGPLESRIQELRSTLGGLQAGLDAMHKARGQ